MHVVLCHDAVIPPPKYGGTERVVYWQGVALLTQGHSVTLIAREGSAIPGAAFVPYSEDWHRSLPMGTDVVHLWSTPAVFPKVPFVVTIQGNGQIGEAFHPNTIFVSRKHAENHGSDVFVHNGIDPTDYPCDEQRKDHLVFLAKASWSVKNLRGAIAIARVVGRPLEVLGSRDLPWEMNRWLPSIRGVRYRGMVGDVEKKEILRNAHALLFPVRWHEPFGVAITEALASGCPVFGTPYGSLPEIVTSEVGYLGTGVDELAQAIRSRTFDRAQCRKRVMEGMSHADMAKKYLMYYERAIRGVSLSDRGSTVPRVLSAEGLSSKALLSWQN